MSQADDRIIDDLLRRRREEGPPLGGPLCGDPELLAAFAEDALAGQSRDEMERHLAACVVCREAVARLVRLAPRPAVVAPEPQAAWWKRWVWAAPALAGVVLVGSFVMFNRQRIVEQPQLVAKQQPAKPAAVPQQPAANPPASTDVTAAKPERRSAAKEETRAAAPLPPPVSVAAETEAKREKDQKEAQVVERAEAKADVDAVARQSQARDQAQVQAAPAPSQQQVQVFAKAPSEAAQQGEPAKGAAVGGLAVGAGQAKSAGAMLRTSPSSLAKAESETASARPGAMNVLADDRVDKMDKSKKLGLLLSADTKVAQTVRVKGTRQVWNLLADGRLLLSLDGGTNWKEVAVPERPKTLTVRDAGHAEITTNSGRVYRTTDAGASWVLVPPR